MKTLHANRCTRPTALWSQQRDSTIANGLDLEDVEWFWPMAGFHPLDHGRRDWDGPLVSPSPAP